MPDTPVAPPGSGRYPADMESRVAVLEQIARSATASSERIERRFDAVDRRFDAVDRRFDVMERRFDALSAEHRSDFRWLLGIMLGGFGAMLGGFGAMLGVMAHGFHWL
jgi:hypothetical protein